MLNRRESVKSDGVGGAATRLGFRVASALVRPVPLPSGRLDAGRNAKRVRRPVQAPGATARESGDDGPRPRGGGIWRGLEQRVGT